MILYAANCTPQQYELCYRLVENPRSLKQLIKSGFNGVIGDNNLAPRDIDGIIHQNEKYGMVEYGKHEQAMKDGVQISLIFRRDEPVPAGLIGEVIARNRKDLTATGKRRREDLAVAAARTMNEDPERSDHVSVTIEEAEQGTMSREGGGKLEEGYAGPESVPIKRGEIKTNRRRGK